MPKTKEKQLLDAVQFTKGKLEMRGYIVSLAGEGRGEPRQWAPDYQEAYDAADKKRRGSSKLSGEVKGKSAIVVVTKTRPADSAANVRFKDVVDGDEERTQNYVSMKIEDLQPWPKAPEAPTALIPDNSDGDEDGDDDESED